MRRREEEVRAGGKPVVPITTFVREQTREDFDRARVIASRKEGRTLTAGETFETVVEHYLDTFDFERVAPGTRRCPATALVNGRYVPMAVRREVYERQGQRCAVPLCDNTMFLELAHLVAHASGGDREAENLVLLCSRHHEYVDDHTLRILGTAAQPVFIDEQGRDFSRRFEPGGSLSCAQGRQEPVGPPAPSARTTGPPHAVG